jgi:hypothetical protein
MTELSGNVSCMVELMGDPLYEKRFFQGAKGHTGACFDKDFIVWYYILRRSETFQKMNQMAQ